MQETLTDVETVRRELGAALLVYKSVAPFMVPNLTAGAEAFIQICRRLADAEKRISELETALEQSASIADRMALKCLGDSVCDRCDHADCMEQRSMAKVCRGVAREIRASGVHVA